MGLKETIAAKQAWRALQSRAEQLPNDYTFVYREIQKYYLKVAPIETTSNLTVLSDLLTLFEAGAAEGKNVLAITGDDVAAFADALLAAA